MNEIPMQVDICVFRDGEFVYHGRHCPHGNTSDETGLVMPPGWTAQQTHRTEEQHHGRFFPRTR